MKKNKLLMLIVLTLLSVTWVQAQQTYNDTVRLKTWTLYAAGGVSGYRGLRGGLETGVQRSIAPDLSLGLKYNINPGVRIGLNFGYTMIKAKNDGVEYSQTVTPGFQIGEYKDATLTVSKTVFDNRIDNHLAGADLNFDINLLSGLMRKNEHFNIWIGSGVGYYLGWSSHTITTSVSEEAETNGDEHIKVFAKYYNICDEDNDHVHALYFPVRLSMEYDVSQRCTIGVKAEGRYLPLVKAYTARGMWSGNLTLAYNIVGKRYRKQAISDRYERIITHLNRNINDLKDEVSDLNKKNKAIAEAKALQEKEAEAIKGVEDARNMRETLQEQEQVKVQDLEISKSRAEQVSDIADLANIILDNPFSKIYIIGYSSADGRKEYSKKLSALRADDIANILIKRFRIDAKRIVINGEVPAGGNYKVYEYRNLASLVIDFGR